MNKEFEVMGKQIEKVSKSVNKILSDCPEDKKPEVKYGWNGTSIDLYLDGGSYHVRNMVESHIVNSSKYRSVSISNNDTKKHLNFYLK